MEMLPSIRYRLDMVFDMCADEGNKPTFVGGGYVEGLDGAVIVIACKLAGETR